MSKDSSPKYYQDYKERLQKRLFENNEVFPNKRNKKSSKMVVSNLSISQKIQKAWLSVEKNISR